MWTFNYICCILSVITLALIIYAINRHDRVIDRLNDRNKKFNELKEITIDRNNTIKELQYKINQISTKDGISPQYREIIDNLEKQNVKDKEIMANYETKISGYETDLINCKELVDTLKSDIIALKSKPRTDRFKRVHIRRPSVNSDIPLKEIPKNALVQAIYFIECSSLGLKKVTLKEIVRILGYDTITINCRYLGSILRDMHFKLQKSRDGMVLLLDQDRNRKKLDTLYRKYCNYEK